MSDDGFNALWDVLIPPLAVSSGPDEIPDPTTVLFQRAQLEATLAKSSDDDWDTEISDTPIVQKTIPVSGLPLEKAYSSMRHTHRHAAIAQFIRKSLATGESVNSLCDYAAQHDQETADLIRAVASELGY